MHYVKTNKEGSLKILRKHLQITDAEAVEGTYKFFAERLSVRRARNWKGSKISCLDRLRSKKPFRVHRHELARRN